MLPMASKASDMTFTSSDEPKSGVDPRDDPLGEASFIPRYLVCVNPLCRRKWKQLTPKSIPMFCPSCKKASELALRETWEGVTDDTLYFNVLKYWHSIYVDIQSTLGFPKCSDLTLPQDPKEVTIYNVMDYYYKAFPEPPHPEDVRNWSSMGQRKKQMTGTIIRQCGTLLWELTVLEDLQQHPHGGSIRQQDMVGHRFYLIDWRGALKIGDHIQFVAFPNPSVDERNKLPHVLKVLDDRVNPPHRQAEQPQDTTRGFRTEQQRRPVGRTMATNKSYDQVADSYYRPSGATHWEQRQSDSSSRRFPQYDGNDNRRSYGGPSNDFWTAEGPPYPPNRNSTNGARGTSVRSSLDGQRQTAVTSNSSSADLPVDQKSFSPAVGSPVDATVAPPPGFEGLADDTHLALGQLAQLLSAAVNKEVPPTPQAPTLEPKVPESAHPSPSPAMPPARRPDWIPDTPASPLYLHRDMNFGQTPNPLVQFLQMQAAAGAAGQVPSAPPSRSYGAAVAPPPMTSPFMPMGGPLPVSAAAVGLEGDLAGLAAWGASWPSSGPSGMIKRQSTSQPPTPIQEETVNDDGEVCAPPRANQPHRQ